MTDTDDFNLWHNEPLVVVISGPSGAGKDSVIAKLKEYQRPFKFVVTATTRPPRDDEQHGVNYFFLSKDQFSEMIAREELIEYALVYDQYKGIPREQVRQALQSGQDVVMRVDVQGAATVRQKCPEAVFIFLTAESEEAMVRRLKKRCTENAEELELRIAAAHEELKRVGEFDYVVVNRDNHLDDAVNAIIAIIEAEHHRVNPRKVTL